MTPDEGKETYQRMLEEIGEKVLIRRYFGTGNNRSKFEVEVRARIVGYIASELVGTIIQGDQKAILLQEDLLIFQFPLPLMKNDKIVVKGKERNIESADGDSRKIGGELIAWELQIRG
jgi:hypothetical protein